MSQPTAAQVANKLAADSYSYYGEQPKAWTSGDGRIARIYFGRDFVTIVDGKATNEQAGKARSKTIGRSAVDAVQAAIDTL